MGAVFAKTSRGYEEIDTKAGGLTPRQRRVLIMVDGKRTVDDLRAMLQADDLQHTLGLLEEDGFIQIKALINGSIKTLAPEASLPSITAFTDLPEAHDPLRQQQARNFMLNTLNVFVGSLGATSLIDRIENANGHDGLRELYDEWYHAIIMSREGKREAEALRGKLLKVI